MPVSGNVNRVNCNQIHINRVGRIRIRIIIRILRYGINAVFSSLPPPYPNSVFPYVRINTVSIRQYTAYFCRIVLGNSKPQPFWSWLEPVIVKQVTDGVEGLVCKLKCMKGGVFVESCWE